MGFVAATLVFGETYRAGLGAALSARYVPTDVVVTSTAPGAQQDLLEQVRAVPEVASAEAQPTVWANSPSVALTGLGGTAFTTVAAYAPASRAMRIAPLAALRPVADTAEQRWLSLLRLLVAGSMTVVGVLLLGWAGSLPSLLVAMAGGVLSSCGILLLTRSFLPATLRLVGRLGAAFGPPGRLAAANASRNPARAAATTAALMLGVGLIVTLQVGASSAEASLDRSFAERYPVDVAVSSSGSPISDSIVAAIAATDGIQTSGVLRGAVIQTLGAADDSAR